jgi:hypothetical protein
MYSKYLLIFIAIFLLCGLACSQSILIGGNFDLNSCLVTGPRIKNIGTILPQQQKSSAINRTFQPGFNTGFVSDFYPLKTKRHIFLISIKAGYQQYSQAVTWLGYGNNQYKYVLYESKINRELYYALLAGVNIKRFVFKTGLTFMQTIANSGEVSVSESSTIIYIIQYTIE